MITDAALADCARCRTPLEDGDLRCAVCALPAPLPPPRLVGEGAQVLRCTECNAAVSYAPAVKAPHCAFCGAVMAIEQVADPIEAARRRVPFAVERDAAIATLRGWLAKRGWLAPKELHREAVFESLVPVSWASWVVDARASVAWTADSDQGAKKSAWAPHSGQVDLSFERMVVPATRGLTVVEANLLGPYYDLSTAVDAAAEGEHAVEGFEAQRSAARAQVHVAMERVAKTRVERHIPGRRFRNIHVACRVVGLTTDRVALPAWVLSYRYRGTPYRAIVHGQRRDIVFGQSPIDWTKLALVALGVAAAVAVLLLVLVGLR